MSLSLIVGGCTAQPPAESTGIAPQKPAGSAASSPSKPPGGLGLVPLPSPQQVAASVALGRLDPFSDPRPPAAPATAPAGATTAGAAGGGTVSPAAGGAARPTTAAAAGAGAGNNAGGAGGAIAVRATPIALPNDFSFNGVMASGGRAEAFVQTGSQSGAVRVGEVGGPHNPWLPRGWTVAAIDGQQGAITLRRGTVEKRLRVAD